jgi:hypothetical protein
LEGSAFEIPRTMSSVMWSVSKRIESRDVTTKMALCFIRYSSCSMPCRCGSTSRAAIERDRRGNHKDIEEELESLAESRCDESKSGPRLKLQVE